MSDLRDRLAEALENVSADHDIPMPGFYTTADAILAAFPELERRYEVGAAVEELPLRFNVIERDPTDGKWCISGDSLEDDWHDTLPAAIRAALEDER